jgi:hypothetical protein
MHGMMIGMKITRNDFLQGHESVCAFNRLFHGKTYNINVEMGKFEKISEGKGRKAGCAGKKSKLRVKFQGKDRRDRVYG